VKWQTAVKEISQVVREAGIPSIWGGMSGAPFDLIGDMLRGTRGIMMDMYQRPDKLQEAMERITLMIIDEAVGATNISGCPVVIMPLHKGPDGFMSNKQFGTFY
jgi:uroporphyrinogen-III decarboxylase